MSNLTHLGLPALGGPRECGSGRTAGSIYAECGLSLHGQPIERFVHDPPIPVDPVQLGLSAQGVTVISDARGTRHLVDWVGSEHYRYPADFIHEARVMGVSRKVPVTADLRGLNAASMLILLHAKGALLNAGAVGRASDAVCPNGTHQRDEACCALHWVVPEPTEGSTRTLKCGPYSLTARHPAAPAPVFTAAYFMAVPITNLTVIRHHDGSVNARALASAGKSSLPVVTADL